MAEEEGSWNDLVKEWLIDPGWCDSGGLVTIEDGVLYAAYPDDKMWQSVFESQVTAEDYTTKTITINEPSTLCELLNNKGPTKFGVYLAGQKYQFVKKELILGFDGYVLARAKGGVFVVPTGNGTAVIATFDESLEMTVGNCCETAVGFAKWLAEQGY
eukprot:GHVR01119569.1.p1 GENE.GHVR01119569.1~~GHVR01119569.1.p1  ORF type:complete len:158 (-),score=45.84 GHVR01119569.1:72-545(-)